MIPKIIHYCWFGGNPIPAEYKNILRVGENISLIMKLENGMRVIMM